MSLKSTTRVNQYLTFTIAQELFALEISKIREVLDIVNLTAIPQMPDYMRGVINLRGHVVPVIDMRSKFGLPVVATTVDSCIIINEVKLNGQEATLGTLVDSVQEVLDLDSENIEAPPQLGSKVGSEAICGMGKHDERLIILLDIDQLITTEQLTDLPTEACETIEQSSTEV